MKIHISFDYELFFGSASGSANKCILFPTQQLISIAKKHNVSFIFFIDAGYLWQLKNHNHIAQCKKDYDAISIQLNELQINGHEIALHIHPHWEDSFYVNNAWQIDTTRYKLANFNDDDVEAIITKYHQAIINITQKPCKSYRAGGWCIQPFNAIKKALIKNNIYIDSTVYNNGIHTSNAHSYNFSSSPKRDEWKFTNDPCIEDSKGIFTEVPITSDKISPVFYFNLYLKMRLNPSIYVPVGDGKWLQDKKRKYRHFYSVTNHFACADGFFASRLKSILEQCQKQNKNKMMVLSHPKSMAPYSFKTLDTFIMYAKDKNHTFSTLAD